MKSVFRLWKMIDYHKNELHLIKLISSIVIKPNNWIVEMEGLTKEDFINKNYQYNDEWFVEEFECV